MPDPGKSSIATHYKKDKGFAMLCQAEYSDDGYFRIFEADDDFDAIRQAEMLAEEGDFVFSVFEITEDYQEIRTIL